MTLSEFILGNLEPILVEWEAYARSIPAAAGMETVALRDHAEAMLRAIAADIALPQTSEQQDAKSKGRGPRGLEDTASEVHAVARHADGFSLSELVSEYRALRASVIRLWTREMDFADRGTLDELTRFNEAIDQALTESIDRYSKRLDRSRELLLGVLGHDLRSPLGAVLNSATYLMHAENLTGPQLKAASSIVRGGERIQGMISDLLDVTSTRLGRSLPITLKPINLRSMCRQVVEETRAYHPERVLLFSTSGRLDGSWDEARIGQLLGNLVENAILHGASDTPVTIFANGNTDAVQLSVHNQGTPIPEGARSRIFEPLVQQVGDRSAADGRGAGLGLGLYIARAIVDAHGGSIDLQSSEETGTMFTAHLPRSRDAGVS